ncbi:nuclease type I family protein [Abortiporus biennis]
MHTHTTTICGLTALALFTSSAYAWGALGHQTIGFVAQEFLAPNAAAFVQKHLNSTFNHSLGTAATWADDVKGETAFKWSANLHFVDAEDSAPDSCSVEEERDCSTNICILAAIANYTARVVDTSLNSEQTFEALAFIDHFLGDIGQPLHVEAVAAGGNDISAVCGGSKTNLHATWDTGMVTKHVSLSHGGTSQSYAADLVQEIKTGSFSSLTSSWLECSSTTETLSQSGLQRRFEQRSPETPTIPRRGLVEVSGLPFVPSDTVGNLGNGLKPKQSGGIKRDINKILQLSKRAGGFDDSTIVPLECPLVWARETNAFDCTVVFDFEQGQDLCTGTYFNNAIPVIDLQLAKQGFRLAAWLNVLFDGETFLD